MRVLLIHRYFWPDAPPYGHMLKKIGERLAADGRDVTVLTSQTPYKTEFKVEKRPWNEVINGVKVERVWTWDTGRWRSLTQSLNAVMFSLRVFFHILPRRYDVVMISTIPQILGGAAVRLACLSSGSRYIYHCMDLHPEIMLHAGLIRRGMVYGLLERIDSMTINGSEMTVALSGDMKNTLLGRGGIRPEKIKVINNFELKDDTEAPSQRHEAFLKRKDRFRVIFAGNIGAFQGLENLMLAARLLEKRAEIEFVFMGEGKRLAKLMEMAGPMKGRTVNFIPHQPVHVARRIIADADLGVISLDKGVYRHAFPSKLMTYSCEGIPSLAIVEADSELARMVADNGLGYSVAQGDPASIANAIENAYERREEGKMKIGQAREYILRNFSMEGAVTRWSELFMGMDLTGENRRCIQ